MDKSVRWKEGSILQFPETPGPAPEDNELLYDAEYKEMLNAYNKVQYLYDAGIAFSIIGLVTNGAGPVLNDGEERKVMENGIY